MNRRDSLKTIALGSIGSVGFATPWRLYDEDDAEKELPLKNDSKPTDCKNLPDAHYAASTYLVAEKQFILALKDSIPENCIPVARDEGSLDFLTGVLASGSAMIWIGDPEAIPADLSIGAFRPSEQKCEINFKEDAPLLLNNIQFNHSRSYSAYIHPPKEMPVHNIDEEIRADFIPILTSLDRYGNETGYPGALMSYYAPSLTAGRFKGCECFFFLFDEPLDALDIESWKSLLQKISVRRRSGVQITAFNADFASYRPGEKPQIRCRISNRRPAAVSVVLRYSAKAPGDTDFKPLTQVRRVPLPGCETEAISAFLPQNTHGLWTIKLEVRQDITHAEELAETGNPEVIDIRYIGFVVIPQPLSTFLSLKIKGPVLEIDGKQAFWTGTHYYPSSSWWEWLWRDFRPLKAAEDFAAIRRAGYRIVRIWIDPVLDEISFRSMDTAIYLAAENEIVLDICIFTQWVRQIGFERVSGEQVVFDFRHPKDFNIISFSLRHLDLQREYVSLISKRWKNVKNIIYDLANEVYVKDPDSTQMDPEALSWNNIPVGKGTVRDTSLFRRWAEEMTRAIRRAGGQQPVMAGYVFSTLNGGDVYLANQDAPLVPWHSYLPPEDTALTVQYFDPISSDRPLILEEFGTGGWNSLHKYDADAHYALAAGATAVMSYEWGISWLARESCFYPLPLREALSEHPDPRWFPPYTTLDGSWNIRGVGICPTPSGFHYGSIYHGTPFQAPAARALSRLGELASPLKRVKCPENTYIIIPAANLQGMKPIKKVLKTLWSHGIMYGICQEINIENLPETTKIIICPVPLSERSKNILKRFQKNGVRIVQDSDALPIASLPDRVVLSGNDNISIIGRRTPEGTLLVLAGNESPKEITLAYRDSKISLMNDSFSMLHITHSGVSLIEAAGNISIGSSAFCNVDSGRLLIRAEDQKSLLYSKHVILMVTKPCQINFNRTISYIRIKHTEEDRKIADKHIMANHLLIDDQMAAYPIEAFFL